MSPEPLRAVPWRACGYLALRVVDDVVELGAAMVQHIEQAGCNVEA